MRGKPTAGDLEIIRRVQIRMQVLRDLDEERERQDAKWGPVRAAMPDGTGGPDRDSAELAAKEHCRRRSAEGKTTFADILEEEVAEALAGLSGSRHLRHELVQVGAVVVKWLEAIALRELERKVGQASG